MKSETLLYRSDKEEKHDLDLVKIIKMSTKESNHTEKVKLKQQQQQQQPNNSMKISYKPQS